MHGDLKPANLLLDSNSRRVKIADFGSSSFGGGGGGGAAAAAAAAAASGARAGGGTGGAGVGVGGGCGGGAAFSTPAFRSPESLASGYRPSSEMDMWALGVCVFMWVFGELPFTGAAPFVIYERIRSQDLRLPSVAAAAAAATDPAAAAADGAAAGSADGAAAPSAELLDFISALLNKDAARRLDVAAAMRHPWVTQGGIAPLRSRTAGELPAPGAGGAASRLSQEEVEGAISLADAPLRERVEAVFTERSYADGEVLVAPGDAADTVFLIAAGEVDILAPPLLGGAGAHGPLVSGLELEDDAAWCGGGGPGGGGAPGMNAAARSAGGAGAGAAVGLSSAAAAEAAAAAAAEELLLDADPASVALLEGGARGGVGAAGSNGGAAAEPAASEVALLGEVIAAGAAHHHHAALPRPGSAPGAVGGLAGAGAGDWDDERRTLAVKGPGDSLGLPSLMDARGGADAAAGRRWRVFCRARGAVTVFTARARDLIALAASDPEAEPAVQQLATQQETDMAVAEAMRRLRLAAAGGAAAASGGAALLAAPSGGAVAGFGGALASDANTAAPAPAGGIGGGGGGGAQPPSHSAGLPPLHPHAPPLPPPHPAH